MGDPGFGLPPHGGTVLSEVKEPVERDAEELQVRASLTFSSVDPEVELNGISASLEEDESLCFVVGDFHFPAARQSC